MYFGHISFSFFRCFALHLFCCCRLNFIYSFFRFQRGSVWSKIVRGTFYGHSVCTVATAKPKLKKKQMKKRKTIRHVYVFLLHTYTYSIRVGIRIDYSMFTCLHVWINTHSRTQYQWKTTDRSSTINDNNLIWQSMHTIVSTMK